MFGKADFLSVSMVSVITVDRIVWSLLIRVHVGIYPTLNTAKIDPDVARPRK